jgi:nucleoside-diphosphate-sugar epimerase
MEAALACGVRRVVHCSTVGVHGDVSAPADEGAPFAPGDVYQQTKLEGELLVQDYIGRGLPATVFRPVGIYGPGDLRFLKLFRTIRDGTFRMIGDGDVLYHMTFIDDLADGILLCGEHPAAVGRTYILAGPRYTTLTELAQAIGRAVGRAPARMHVPFGPMMLAARACEAICRPLGIEPPLHRRRLDFFAKDRGFSCARARSEIGYEPRVDLDEGAARTAAWYRTAGYL